MICRNGMEENEIILHYRKKGTKITREDISDAFNKRAKPKHIPNTGYDKEA